MTQHNIQVLQATFKGMMYVLSIRLIPPDLMSHTLVAALFWPNTQVNDCHTIKI
jgi:hypothetical protein